MGEEQKNRTLYLALLSQDTYNQRYGPVNLYSSLKIWQLVERSFLLSPVKLPSPVCTQSFHVSQPSAITPFSLVELVGKGGCGFRLLGESVGAIPWGRDGDHAHV